MVEILKSSYKDLKGGLEFTQGQVQDLTTENKSLKAKCERLENDYEDLEQRLFEVENKQDELEQYTRKFNLEIHGIPEREEEDNMASLIKLGSLVGEDISRDDIDIVHRLKKKKTVHRDQSSSVSVTTRLKENITKPEQASRI